MELHEAQEPNGQNEYFTFMDNGTEFFIAPLSGESKQEAENKLWGGSGEWCSYMGIYTREELQQVLAQASKAIVKYGDTRAYGIRSVLNPSLEDSTVVALPAAALGENIPDGFYDVVSNKGVELLLESADAQMLQLVGASGRGESRYFPESNRVGVTYAKKFLGITYFKQDLCNEAIVHKPTFKQIVSNAFNRVVGRKK